jgi:tRNA(Ile)-lysidine synthase
VPFRAVGVEVSGEGGNLEANARAARYRVFARYGAPFIALAHHRDDQAETLLLNLLRGSGVHGLAGMPRNRALPGRPGAPSGAVHLIRPLLGIPRQALLRYAQARRLRWIEDESNSDPRHARNFLRLRVIPMLERRFPGAHETLARSAALLGETARLLDDLAAADCAAAGDGRRLQVQRLCALGEARAANALRHFLASHGEAPPSLARTREMLRQLTGARADAQPAIGLERSEVRRFRGWIELVAAAASAVPGSEPLHWNGERSMRLPDGTELIATRVRGDGVSAARLRAAEVTIRRRRGGERMRIARLGSTRTLKNLLQEAGVAPWVRAQMPLVYCGERFAWAPFVGVAADFRAAAGEPAWRFCWRAQDAASRIG